MSFLGSFRLNSYAWALACALMISGNALAQEPLLEEGQPQVVEESAAPAPVMPLDEITPAPDEATPAPEIVAVPAEAAATEAVVVEPAVTPDPVLELTEQPAAAPEPVTDAPPVPATEQLASPGASAPDVVVKTETTVVTEEVPVVPALPANEDADENLFFDAESLVPAGEMSNSGPVKVNPRLQPGSKLIVVKKNYEAGSRQAQLVSAERAIKLGRYDAALTMYDELYAKNKTDANVILGRATALQHLGRNEAAIQAYEELLALRPNNVEAQVNMLGLLGQRYPAVSLQRLIELREDGNENNVGIAAQIAVMQAELGHYNEALQYLGMAASMEPNNASHLFNMAVIADRAGIKEEAIKYYEQALETDAIYGGSNSIPREAVFERLAQLR